MSQTTPSTAAAPQRRKGSWRLLLSSPTGLAGLIVLAALIVVAIGARWVSPQDPNAIDVPNAL